MRMTDPLAVSIADAVRLAGVGRTTIYAEIREGRLVARKVGKRTLIGRDDLAEWLTKLPHAGKHHD
jgi:excisionase family DNA binding protein